MGKTTLLCILSIYFYQTTKHKIVVLNSNSTLLQRDYLRVKSLFESTSLQHNLDSSDLSLIEDEELVLNRINFMSPLLALTYNFENNYILLYDEFQD
jgi:reverse gyrase